MKTFATTLLAALLLAVATPGRAQDEEGLPPFEPLRPLPIRLDPIEPVRLEVPSLADADPLAGLSARERDYARHLADALGRRLEGGRRHEVTDAPLRIEGGITAFMGDGSPRVEEPAPAARVVGHQVEVELEGARITRSRFASADEAFAYADELFQNDFGDHYLIEARGNQVVLIESPDLADPAGARRLHAAAWGGLPAPQARTEALGLRRGDEVVGTVARAEGAFYRVIRDTIAASHRHREALSRAGAPIRASWRGDDAVRVDLSAHGRVSDIEDRGAQGGTCWFATSVERGEELGGLVSDLSAPAPSRGAGGLLDALGSALGGR